MSSDLPPAPSDGQSGYSPIQRRFVLLMAVRPQHLLRLPFMASAPRLLAHPLLLPLPPSGRRVRSMPPRRLVSSLCVHNKEGLVFGLVLRRRLMCDIARVSVALQGTISWPSFY